MRLQLEHTPRLAANRGAGVQLAEQLHQQGAPLARLAACELAQRGFWWLLLLLSAAQTDPETSWPVIFTVRPARLALLLAFCFPLFRCPCFPPENPGHHLLVPHWLQLARGTGLCCGGSSASTQGPALLLARWHAGWKVPHLPEHSALPIQLFQSIFLDQGIF